MQNERPLTIENRWDIFYRDYPEIYEEFGCIPKSPSAFDVIDRLFHLKGKTVLDVGSGTGLSTFDLARRAAWVTGVEPEENMRRIALKNAAEQNITNVNFLSGWAEALPVQDQSVDMLTAITLASLYSQENIAAFAREALRVVKPGGIVMALDIAPRWYGGDLAPVILGKNRQLEDETLRDEVLEKLDFRHKDFYNFQDYGTLDHIVATYGFIFGQAAIDYLRAHHKTTIKWKWRIHYRQV
jgi:ubiquinone/menaquinone biosynthesis C-methylase UbiE